MYIILIKFVICAGCIFFAGKNVAKYADSIAEQTGLSRIWIGVILVSLATSLPELFTGIGSVSFAGAPDIAIGNLFGANSYNLLTIAIIDLLSRGAPLLSVAGPGQVLTAAFSLIPVMLATIGIALSGSGIFAPSIANIGIFSIAIFLSYCIFTRAIYVSEKKPPPPEPPYEPGRFVRRSSLRKTWFYFGLASAVIVVNGIWLAYIGKELSETLHLSQNFVGGLILGLITTLPEITVSVAALLIGAKEIALANMLGSNLFNMTIIFVDDIFYKKAPVLQSVSPDHIWQGCMVMVMTAVVILAMVTKGKKRIFNISWYTPVIFVIFLLGAYMNFQMR